MALPSFTLTGSIDTLEGVEQAALVSTVRLTPNFPWDSFLSIAAADELLLIQPLEITLVNGAFSVELLADDESLGLGTALQWQVKIGGLPSWWFDAPANGETIDLKATSAVTGVFPVYSTGADGTNGIDGTDGTDGQDGAPGAPGSPGAPGAPGTNGTNGTNGTDGVDAPRNLPAYVTTAPNQFDANTGWYNLTPANTRRLRAGLGKAVAGLGPSHHFIVGDSLSSYWLGTVSDPTKIWHQIMRNRLNVPIGGTGIVPFADAGGNDGDLVDPRLYGPGSYRQSGGLFWHIDGGTPITFTSDLPGTVASVVYAGGSAPFTITVDGGSPTTITPSGEDLWLVAEVTGLADTTHVVALATSGDVYLSGISVNRTSGLIIDRLSFSGASAESFLSGNWTPGAHTGTANGQVRFSSVYNITPDVVWVELGANEDTSTDAAQNAALALITQIMDLFPDADIIFVQGADPGNQTMSGNWASWLTKCYALADSRDIPFLDIAYQLGDQATQLALGLKISSDVHPNAAAHALWGTAAAHPFL